MCVCAIITSSSHVCSHRAMQDFKMGRHCFFTEVKHVRACLKMHWEKILLSLQTVSIYRMQGKLAQYRHYHDNIFPEVARGLRAAGIIQVYQSKQSTSVAFTASPMIHTINKTTNSSRYFWCPGRGNLSCTLKQLGISILPEQQAPAAFIVEMRVANIGRN